MHHLVSKTWKLTPSSKYMNRKFGFYGTLDAHSYGIHNCWFPLNRVLLSSTRTADSLTFIPPFSPGAAVGPYRTNSNTQELSSSVGFLPSFCHLQYKDRSLV